MIHNSQLHKLVQPPAHFSLKFVKRSGEVIAITEAECTSFYSEGQTLNIQCHPSMEVRKVRRSSIIEFNGEEVSL